MPRWAESRGITGSFETLCTNGVVKQGILASMVDIGKESGLKSFEQVKDIFLTSEMFSVENELLTPTLKSKRSVMKKHFADQIADMYAKLN
ncbi:long-chain-fatty-acid--CoA ligase 6-like [Saccoglossus kowalevskii]